MKKHQQTKWLSTLYRGFMLSAALLLVSGLAMAQLDGTYTINSASATSGTNFKTFAALTSALSSNGVKGAVTVNVVKGSGPYAEKVTLPPASGASATNTITINGNGETVTNTASSSVFDFNGADYYTISDVKMIAAGTGTGTRVIHLWKGANYNTVKGCDLVISKYTGTNRSTGYVVMSNSATGNSAALHGSHNTIENNKMSNGGASSSVGPYYGCVDYRSSSYAGTTGNNVFKGNDMSNIYYYWFYMYYANGFTIDNNKLHDDRSNAGYAYTLYAYFCSTTTHSNSFSGNDISKMSPTNYLYNYTYQTSGTSSLPFKINDNKIHDNSCNYFYNYLGYFGSYLELYRNEVY
ncbi:MAG: hypothetical protein ACI9JN_002850, partial [Bacteroidia bacterium]